MATSTNLLKLTDAVNNQAAFALYTTPVSSAQGLSISFDLYSYGGTGADGISFFLVNGAVSPKAAGAFGGSLGYAQSNGTPGLAGGYLGVGFDEFGNYSNPTENRVGGPGMTPDAVAVRGSESTGYAYLGGTGTLTPGLDNPVPGATRDSSRRHAKIDLSPTGALNVSVDLNNDGDFADPGETLALPNVIAANGALPATLKFGFAASTGQYTNVHEVGNFDVRTFNGTPVSGSFTDVLLIGQDGGGTLTGGSGNSTLQAGSGDYTLVGQVGNDTLIAGSGTDTLTGGSGADRFEFAGATKAAALRSSTLRNLDRITDFKYAEGDRFELNYDNNVSTIELPKRLYNAGVQKGGNLLKAVRSAYADKLPRKGGAQGLKADEALFFTFKGQTYLSVNNSKPKFSANDDLLVNVTGIQFAPGDTKPKALAVRNYFA